MPTNDTPPSKSQFWNYIALIIFGALAVLAWVVFIAITWFNRGTFHGTDWWVTHLPFLAPAIFLTACAWAIRRDIRKNQAAAEAAKKKA